MTSMTRAVLFDLDGTLLDTLPDLANALNKLRSQRGLEKLPAIAYRHSISLGVKGMLKAALDIDDRRPSFTAARDEFLSYYESAIATHTIIFPNMLRVLTELYQRAIPWGIVTNKNTRYTHAILETLTFPSQPGCVVCGDTLDTFKPDPAPLRHAAMLLKEAPSHCLYVGDAMTDVTASKAAGMRSLVALYGYIGEEQKPQSWQADGYINDPSEIINWL